MDSELVSSIESRLLKGKAILEQGENEAAAPRQARLELFFHKTYSIPARPDVEIERTVVIYRSRGRRLVAKAKYK